MLQRRHRVVFAGAQQVSTRKPAFDGDQKVEEGPAGFHLICKDMDIKWEEKAGWGKWENREAKETDKEKRLRAKGEWDSRAREAHVAERQVWSSGVQLLLLLPNFVFFRSICVLLRSNLQVGGLTWNKNVVWLILLRCCAFFITTRQTEILLVARWGCSCLAGKGKNFLPQ